MQKKIVESLTALRNVIISFIKKQNIMYLKPVIVTFTGGMGAQIISAAIYFYLRDIGREVYADLTYYEKQSHIAIEGKKDDISHWDWQLGPFGILLNSFQTTNDININKYEIIGDGVKKISLGIHALKVKCIQEYFTDKNSIDDIIPIEFLSNYLCIHIRRGDYVNVASYIVGDELFIDLVKRIYRLVDCAVVVSDSYINDSFRNEMSVLFKNVLFLDEVDALTAHRVMRNAPVLICSNSQFSLIAALLNRNALVFLPKKWFGENYKQLEMPINEICDFQILKN